MSQHRGNREAPRRQPAGAPLSPREEIRWLYFNATKATIATDLARAIDLLKSLPDEDAQQDVAVYMDGLSQMRSEWAGESSHRKRHGPRRR